VVRDFIVPLPSGLRSVVLGFDSFDPYPIHSRSFGAIIGRFANRVADGRFSLDGHTYQLTRDDGGIHHLHGGAGAFSKRVWSLVDASNSHVTLALLSQDGDSGYPGTLQATCTYSLIEVATLAIKLTATTERATIVNLTHHSYFNLAGSGQADTHKLCVNADFYTPVRRDSIPTGGASVAPGESPLAHAATLRSVRLISAAMIIHGIQPGPMLMIEHPQFIYDVVAMTSLATISILIFGLFLVRPLLLVLRIKRTILMPIIFLLASVGAFASASRLFDVYVMLAVGIGAFFLRRRGYQMAPFVLGLVLGHLLDKSLRRGLVLSDGSISPFFTRPICTAFALVTLVTMLMYVPSINAAVKRGIAAGTQRARLLLRTRDKQA
jgi:aldose 1-epimerase/tripartite tricarboxylate transporter TctA family protein